MPVFKKGRPVNWRTESITVVPILLANREENFPSSNTATGIWLFVNVYKSASDCTLFKDTIAGEAMLLELVSVASKMVFLMPGALTVSILDGKIGSTLSMFFVIGLSDGVVKKG